MSLTSAEYVAAGGSVCPFCGSGDHDYGSWDIQASIAGQDVTCQSCESQWYAEYKLTGYTVIHDATAGEVVANADRK